MGHRLSRIYTRTGDDGTTGLGDGARVPEEGPMEVAAVAHDVGGVRVGAAPFGEGD